MKKLMKILILSWRGLKHPNAGGAEISTHEHAKSWVKAGHQITLFTSYFLGGKKEEIIDGVWIKRYGKQIFGVQWEAFKWYLFGKHPKFDLVIDQFHGIPFFSPLYIRTKKLAFIHEVTKEVWRLNPWPWPFNKIAALMGEMFEPALFKLYKKVPFMTVSKSTKEDLIVWGIPTDQITVIHNGVNLLKKTNAEKRENKKTLIFLGALSKDKGIEDALEVFYLINQMEEDWQFWVAGEVDSRYLKRLKLQSKKLGINKKVKFWGFISEEKKYELLAKAHVAINPSIREGWGLVVIEAASMGVPTVGYDVPGLRDSVLKDKTGILCDPQPKVCAKAILALMSDPEKYRALSYQGINWSKQFKWEDACKHSLRLVKTLVNQG